MQEIIGKVLLDDTYYPGDECCSDGDGAAEELLDIAKKTGPGEWNAVIAERKSWPVLHQFSHVRQNVIEWLPIGKHDSVLEIGSGCGAITGVLAEKAGSVRCIELSKKRSYINAYRNRMYDNIRIDVGDFQNIEKSMTETFDYITLIGVFAYSAEYIAGENPYIEMLRAVSGHLKPGGKMIIAIENRLGLKYWAGCREDHSNLYFDGLEGYHQYDGARTFSKKEWQDIIEQAGGLQAEYYYPYPDYQFPQAIFSDRRLPGQGELNQNFRVFNGERMQVFDETKVYDTLLRSGLFPEFSNSFLILLSKEEPQEEEKTIYVKYSNERAENFSIKTEILEQKDGTRSARKSASLPAGQVHIGHLVSFCEELGKLYEGTDLYPNQIRQDQGGVRFDYIKGITLEEELDTLLQQKKVDEAKALMVQYLETVRGMAKTSEFRMTEEFTRVFGEQSLPEGLRSLPVTDIDLVLYNILVCEGWNIIDYEWTFLFPVPVNFVLYRIILYYQTQEARTYVEDWKLYDLMGIGEQELAAYEDMERHFQAYVQGGRITMWDLYQEMTPELFDVRSMAYWEKQRDMEERLQIFYAGDEYFSEERSAYYPLSEGRISLNFPIPAGSKKLRIDPAGCPGILTIQKLSYGNSQKEVSYISNGTVLDETRILFDSNDPQLWITDLPEDADTLQIDFVMDMTASGICAASWKKKDLLEEKEAENARLKDLLKQREEQINQMENTKIQKLYRRLKKRTDS